MRTYLSIILVLLISIAGCVSPAAIPTQNQTQETIVDNGSPSISEPVTNNSLEEEASPQASPVEIGPQSVYVSLIEGGFEAPEVRIKIGETVAWKNEREGRQPRAMVLGTQWCSFVRSGIFGPGEVYRASFNRTGTCTIVDGMYTTETMKVIVE